MFRTGAGKCIGFLALLCLFLACPVNAEEQQEEYQPELMQQQSPEIEFTDEQLDKAVDAYLQIVKIRDDFHRSVSDVNDPEVAREMQIEAGEAMVEAVHQNGLEVQTYNQIMQAAQVDEDLRSLLLKRLDGSRESDD